MVTVRRASISDLPGIYRVCLLTGDSGRDGSALHSNPDLLGHVYTGPYVVGAPDFSFVIADLQGVAGYCLGVLNTVAFERWEEERWWPGLREQFPLTLLDSFSEPDPDSVSGGLTAGDKELIELIHHPITASADLVKTFPAHLHIDLLDRVRGKGFGRILIDKLLAALRAEGAKGVHLGVALDNPNAIAFYRHLGFEEISQLSDTLIMGMAL
ncbi:MAG: GNAT family N-acetyltransferase [Microbacteriaceae bacterium]|nr:GNAT family N-acetyltransferase [Microbacteriaceae bacterium]